MGHFFGKWIARTGQQRFRPPRRGRILGRLGREEKLETYIKNEGRWLRMLREVATTTFEAWGKDLKWNTFLFHLMYSFVLLYLTDWGQEELLKELGA